MRHLKSLRDRLRRRKAESQNSDSDASSLGLSTAQDGNKQEDEPTSSNVILVSMTSTDISPTPASSVPAVSKAHSGLESRPRPSSIIAHNASLPEHLWDRAYDELKANEAEAALVEAYEKVLSRHLESERDIDANIIAQGNPDARRAQMNQLVTSGLTKIKRETKIKESLDKGVQVIMSAKDIISSAIQTVPQAALAWTGVCVALEIFGNSTSATQANRDGILYVVRRMEWYWELPDAILKEKADVYNHLSKMRGGLEAQLIGLYKLLLLYQMKSVCSYYKHRGLVFLRDIAKLDDWNGDIKAIEKAERLFYKDFDVHQKEKMNANLEEIVIYVQQKMTKEDAQCFKDLGITDPTYDKKRIESTKGGLLEQSYCWILDNPEFQQWRDDGERRLLWIRGDPGKGKTMLLCGIANELRRTSASSGLISYFFCQATDQRINNAKAVLWGLMFMLVDQQPALMCHIRNKYEASGKDLFLGENSWFALSEIFSDMLKDPALTHAYLLIDALDECTSDREKLLDLVVENLSASSHVKWILSSRNWPEIERQLADSEDLERISLSLEVNADLVSRAVDAYIEREISRLRLIKYNPTIKDQIHHQMQQKANGTFLWVALVVKDLRDRQDAEYEDPSYILKILIEMPGDLTRLYSLMMDRIDKLQGDTPNLCQRILSVTALASRPLSLAELRVLAGFDNNHISNQAIERLVNKCGSFLTIRDCTVYFVHQSAKDHLILDKPTQPIIFPSGHSEVHYTIFSHSLRAMTSILKKNIYSLSHPGLHIDEVEIPNPDPLAAIRYSCAHWVDHLCNGISDNSSSTYQNCLDDTGPVSVFLHTHFLHWLEALSLLQKISDNVISITRLENLLKTQLSQTEFIRFLHDGYRFILYFIRCIENAPLQIYSALVFSPVQSVVRQTFRQDFPSWIHTKLMMDDIWSPCLHILEGHSSFIDAIAFSGDSTLATGSNDGTIKIWDIATGACFRTLAGHNFGIYSLLFFENNMLASGSGNGAITIWNAAAGTCIQALEGHIGAVVSLTLLTDNKLASASRDGAIKIWDMADEKCIQTLESHNARVVSITVLKGKRLASGFKDGIIKIWDIADYTCIQTLEGHIDGATSITALANNKLASGSDDGTIRIWDLATGACIQTLKANDSRVTSIIALADDRLASASYDETVRIWDTATGVCIQTLEGHSHWVTSIAALENNKLASASHDGTVRIWDIAAGIDIPMLKGHSDRITSVTFSTDGKQVASGSSDKTIKIWDIATGLCVQTLKGHSNPVASVTFSSDGKQVASGSYDETVKIWDITAGVCIQTLRGHSDWVRSVDFIRDGTQLVSGSGDKTVKAWDIATGLCVQTLKGHNGYVMSVAFSRDGRQVASGSIDETVKIWDIATGLCVQTLEGYNGNVMSVAFSRDGRQVASWSRDKTVKIWDTATGVCTQTLPVGTATQLSFDEEKPSRLQTNFGILDLDSEAIINKAGSEISAPSTGYGINEAGSWITRDGKPLLWLPLDYRPTVSAIKGSMVGIGCDSGRVLMLQFSEQDRFSG